MTRDELFDKVLELLKGPEIDYIDYLQTLSDISEDYLSIEELKELVKSDPYKIARNLIEEGIIDERYFIEDSAISIGDVIKEEKGGYVIYSEKGKKLSKVYKNKKDAEERLKKIEMFKHMKDKRYGELPLKEFKRVVNVPLWDDSEENTITKKVDRLLEFGWKFYKDYLSTALDDMFDEVQRIKQYNASAREFAKKDLGSTNTQTYGNLFELIEAFKELKPLLRDELMGIKEEHPWACKPSFREYLLQINNITKGERYMKDSKKDIVEQGFDEYIKCLEKSEEGKFEYSEKLIEFLHKIEELADMPEQEILGMFEEMKERKDVLKDSVSISKADPEKKMKDANKESISEAEYEALIRHAAHGELLDMYDISAASAELFEDVYNYLALPKDEEWIVAPEVLKEDISMEKLYSTLRSAIISEMKENEYVFDTNHDKHYGEHKGTEEIMKIFNIKKHTTFDTLKYIYQFPSDMTQEDIKKCKEYKLEYLGEVNENGYQPGDHLVRGKLGDLKRYCEEWIGGYEMHSDYLYKETDIDLEDILDEKEIEDKSDSNKLMDLISKCKEVLKRGLIKEGYKDDDEIFKKAEFEVRHEKEGEKNIIIAHGSQEWLNSDFEEEIINDIEDEITNEYPEVEFKWYNNSAGGYWII